MTKLEELRSELRDADSRRDINEAKRLFHEIQRETWRTVPLVFDPATATATTVDMMQEIGELYVKWRKLKSENERLLAIIEGLKS